jgi:ribonuclease E
MPKLESFVLPLVELTDIAQNSGLQWVNSDSEKIAAVQAAIATESKVVHVPRPRPAPVQIDTGSLVMVETKRDLKAMTLPFEEKTPQ